MTIPKKMIPVFADPFFINYPTNYLVFGYGMKPDPLQSVSKNRFNKLHLKIRHKFKKEGKLKNIDGLSFYSWKDTGGRDHTKHVSLIRLVDQMGHSNPRQTMTYYKENEVNDDFRNWPVNL